MEALHQTSYGGYLTFEYFHPWAHYPEALIHQTSDALDRMLGKSELAPLKSKATLALGEAATRLFGFSNAFNRGFK